MKTQNTKTFMENIIKREINAALDKITPHIKSAEGKNYIHACRPGHPLNNPHQWQNAWQYIERNRWELEPGEFFALEELLEREVTA